jgi:hypothetical protein
MVIARPVLLTFLGIAAVGCALAGMAPPAWGIAELILLVACIVLVREYSRALDKELQGSVVMPSGRMRNTAPSDRFAGKLLARVFNPWDVDPEPCVSTQTSTAAGPVPARTQSIEQTAQEMLGLAFRQASLKYHRDQGGNADLLMSGIHRV